MKPFASRSQTERRPGRGWSRPTIERLESRCLLTTVTEFSVPLVNGLNAQPSEILSGPFGEQFLFIEAQANQFGWISNANSPNPQPYPFAPSLAPGANPEGLTLDSSGDVWFTENGANQIGRVELGGPTRYYGTANGMSANAGPAGIISAGGFIWFTESLKDRIGRLDPNTGTITEYAAPAGMTGLDSSIILGADGNLWFTELGAIGIFSPTTLSVVKEVPLPGGSHEEPFGITAGPGGTIWYTDGVLDAAETGFVSYGVGGITAGTQSLIPETSLGASSKPQGITAGADGYVYFTLANAGAVAGTTDVLNPATGTIVNTLAIPTNIVTTPDPMAITAGPDGNIWFTDPGNPTGAIGRVSLDTQLGSFSFSPATAGVNVGEDFGVSVEVTYADTGAVDKDYTGNVALALHDNPGGASLAGTLTTTVHGGTALFGPLSLDKVGAYTFQASAPGSISGVSSSLNVLPPDTATGLSFTSVNQRPPLAVGSPPEMQAGINAGVPFPVIVAAVSSSGVVDTSFNGYVTIALVGDLPGEALGGTITVAAVKGVATFSDLTVSYRSYILGNINDFLATTNGLASASTPRFTIGGHIPHSELPTVVRDLLLFTQKESRKGKPVGRSVLSGFEFDFSTAMNPASAGNPANYLVGRYVTKRAGRKTVKVLQTVGFSVSFNASKNSVTLTLAGNPKFPTGGQITLIATPPGGIQSSAGVFLDGNNQGAGGENGTFTITTNARGISDR